ncbi:MAG: hypothetical protein NUV45_06400 [Tepidanaerobacteraceae bacterium]|jgi:hypothetical protein|nr:hypothetical protein [Tepidanaerobacteraceae bacterium]
MNYPSDVKEDILRMLFQRLEEHCTTYDEAKYYKDDYYRGYFDGFEYAIMRSMIDVEREKYNHNPQ